VRVDKFTETWLCNLLIHGHNGGIPAARKDYLVQASSYSEQLQVSAGMLRAAVSVYVALPCHVVFFFIIPPRLKHVLMIFFAFILYVISSAQYSFGSMAIAIVVMSTTYCTSSEELCMKGVQAPWVAGTANAAVFMGAVVGQLSMGYIGDIIGRSNALMLTMSIATVGNICSAIFPSGSATSVYALVVIFRFFMGIGVGGVYPLSATKAAEDNGNAEGSKVDPRNAAWAFFWQMPGILGPWMVAYLISFNDAMTTNVRWR